MASTKIGIKLAACPKKRCPSKLWIVFHLSCFKKCRFLSWPEGLLFGGLGILNLTGFCCTERCSCCRLTVYVRTVLGKMSWQMTDEARSWCEIWVVVVVFVETLFATKKLVLTTSCSCCCRNRWRSPFIALHLFLEALAIAERIFAASSFFSARGWRVYSRPVSQPCRSSILINLFLCWFSSNSERTVTSASSQRLDCTKAKISDNLVARLVLNLC